MKQERTRYWFLEHVKRFIAAILEDPVKGDIDDELKSDGITREWLLKKLIDRGVIKAEKKIVSRADEKGGDTDRFSIRYSTEGRIETSIKRIYSMIYEIRETGADLIFEDGEGGAMGGGCCGGNGAMGGVTSTQTCGDYQYTVPAFGGKGPHKGRKQGRKDDVMRRTIYLTREQAEMLKEVTMTGNSGDYTYDVPFGGDSETLDHSNMMARSWRDGQKSTRRRRRGM